MIPSFSCTPEKVEEALSARASWDWLVTSGREAKETEDRSAWGGKYIAELPRLTLKRARQDTPHRFLLTVGRREREVNWNELYSAISEHIPPGSAILLDTTHLSFDTLLYLLHALRASQPSALACLYVAPVDFHEIETDPLAVHDTLPIGQPKGYVALTTEETRAHSRHIVLLGFDMGRAWKFIQRYDWDEAHLHLVVGDPPFVENGAAIALDACQPWLEPFQRRFPDHVHALDARNPNQVHDFLLQQLNEANWLDIVPLGPKPMLLGVLAFYFGLSDQERARVRLLYDFSEQRSRRCGGIQMIYSWDCTGFPNP
ncbi:MAG: hypothetical protein Q8O37_09830 [Sulfuricellaceae bacterium]|nr:hypothetical protein [Sulfuricellaceae bacterium]